MIADLPLVFGIGFPKTGTVSLRLAMSHLGYPMESIAIRRVGQSSREWWDFCRPILEANVAAGKPPFDSLDIKVSTDISFDLFRELGDAYPEAKFVITYRDPHEIALSAWRHCARKVEAGLDPEPAGWISFKRVAAQAETHYDDVLRWALLPGNLSRCLILRVCDGEGWEKLCPFLGLPVPEKPFPHAHKH